ncbi:hypothetical protein [Laceyella sacchari]|uniref:hypothetical protein n=1 Tax=Laceyella sacchari TaxID=37482 RepID=UPI00105274D3|nr:hypothetical protein [Laceyella sacchari]
MYEGYFWRQDQLRQFWAAMTAATIQPHSKKRIKPTDLYKPLARAKRSGPVLSEEERRRRFDEIVKKIGPDVIPVRSSSEQ